MLKDKTEINNKIKAIGFIVELFITAFVKMVEIAFSLLVGIYALLLLWGIVYLSKVSELYSGNSIGTRMVLLFVGTLLILLFTGFVYFIIDSVIGKMLDKGLRIFEMKIAEGKNN